MELKPKKNNILVKCPQIMDEWDYDKNNDDGIFPEQISIGNSLTKIHWICSNCGREYLMTANHRYHGQGCRKCAYIKAGLSRTASHVKKNKSFAELHPELLSEWNFNKNELNPNEISEFYHGKVGWKCLKCGYEWEATTGTRLRGRGCPKCAKKISGQKFTQYSISKNGSFADNYPELLVEWNYDKNEVKPNNIPSSYNKNKVWWKCAKCGFEYQMLVSIRRYGGGCPKCNSSKPISLPEKMIYHYVKEKYGDAIENYKPDFLGRKEIDIFIPSLKVGIEYDGEIYHTDINEDLEKTKICAKNGILVIRIREPRCPLIDDSNILNLERRGDYIKIISFLNDKIDLSKDLTTIDLNKDKRLVLSEMSNYEMENSLANKYPELVDEWDFSNNDGLLPQKVSYASNISVKWICKKCGQSYEKTVAKRTVSGRGCPYCSNLYPIKGVNDLATVRPDLIPFWDYEKNAPVTPEDIKEHSNIIFNWKCPTCKNEWKLSTNSMRKRKSKCLFCK